MLLELTGFYSSAIEREKIEGKSFTEVRFYSDNNDNASNKLVTE